MPLDSLHLKLPDSVLADAKNNTGCRNDLPLARANAKLTNCTFCMLQFVEMAFANTYIEVQVQLLLREAVN